MANIDKTVMKCPSDSTTQRDNIYLNLNLKTDILTGEVKILKFLWLENNNFARNFVGTDLLTFEWLRSSVGKSTALALQRTWI